MWNLVLLDHSWGKMHALKFISYSILMMLELNLLEIIISRIPACRLEMCLLVQMELQLVRENENMTDPEDHDRNTLSVVRHETSLETYSSQRCLPCNLEGEQGPQVFKRDHFQGPSRGPAICTDQPTVRCISPVPRE